MSILEGELRPSVRHHRVYGRVALAGGIPVSLEDKKGVVFRRAPEAEALERWCAREFLDVERTIAKQWRRSLTQIDFDAMVRTMMSAIGPWRKPRTLEDAKHIADMVIDYLDPEWLLRFWPGTPGGARGHGFRRKGWIGRRRPGLEQYAPYFVFMLTIDIFFLLGVTDANCWRNVKASHHVDLAYLYYLPFCSVFTSKDSFHVQIVPLFLDSNQTFVNGTDFKAEMQKLNEHYSSLPDEVLKTGLGSFAQYPPDDPTFLTTQLWDKYLPGWRQTKARPKPTRDPELNKALIEEIEKCDSPDPEPRNKGNLDEADYVKVERRVFVRKGKWRRFSDNVEQMNANGERSPSAPKAKAKV